MSLPVDKGKSDAARAEGNISFKKGRWTESIGHYTAAILHNPEDPLAYGNRAQAYLRLDKYADAERDSTIVLEKQKDNVKALYRRSLARKGLERYEEAISDLQRLLEVEPKNETALEEMGELRALRDQAASKAKPRRPLSPSKLAPAGPSPTPKPEPKASVAPVPAETDSARPASSSFASLKASRASKKPAYIPPASTPHTASTILASESIPAAATISDANRLPSVPDSTEPAASASAVTPSTSGSTGKSATTATECQRSTASPPPLCKPPASSSTVSLPASTSTPIPTGSNLRTPQPPTDPTSTAPGTGILLLRALGPLAPASAWALLRLYPPQNVPVILGPILEPDSLGIVLLALAHAVQGDQAGQTRTDEDRQKVRTIMYGLRKTPRIGMNAIMLEPKAAEAGEIAWRELGGEGPWP